MLVPILISISFVLSLCYLIVLVYFRRGWERIPLVRGESRMFSAKVSVLIAARNEETNIGETIDCLLKQDYPKELLEIIIMDDHSTDGTASVIASYADSGVRLIQLNEKEPLNSYKKKAISIGIEAAKGKLIVATDADCSMGAQWLSSIVGMYEQGNYKLISAPVAYFREESLFEKLQTLEFLYLIGIGASTIGLKRPSTCNGANMAYERAVFYELGGFNGIDNLASGDDELFLHKVAEKYPQGIGFCKSQKAIVYTEAKKTLSSFISQRRRWASKSTQYKNKWVVCLGLGVWSYNLSLLVLILLSLLNVKALLSVVILIAVKLMGECYFAWPLTRFFHRRSLLLLMPIVTVLHIVYLVYIGIMGNMGKYNWKGRTVK